MAALEKEIEQISDGAPAHQCARPGVVPPAKRSTAWRQRRASAVTGVHPEFSEHVRALERKKAEKIKVAEAWRTYQLQIVENFYEGDVQSAEDDFIVRRARRKRARDARLPDGGRPRPAMPIARRVWQSEKQSIREQMFSALQEKMKKLEEEKNSMDITSGTWCPAGEPEPGAHSR